MKNRQIYKIMTIISLVCIIISIIIQIEDTKYSLHHNSICSAITGSNGCEVVQTSAYGKTLGVNNSVYGIIGFTILGLSALILIRKEHRIIKYLTTAGGIIAGLIAMVLIYLQAFVLHAYCIFCMIVDTFSLILLGLSIYLLLSVVRDKHRHK
jgi:uncharacterized membrane protein